MANSAILANSSLPSNKLFFSLHVYIYALAMVHIHDVCIYIYQKEPTSENVQTASMLHTCILYCITHGLINTCASLEVKERRGKFSGEWDVLVEWWVCIHVYLIAPPSPVCWSTLMQFPTIYPLNFDVWVVPLCLVGMVHLCSLFLYHFYCLGTGPLGPD